MIIFSETIKELIVENDLLKKKIKELRKALSGRTVSCERCNKDQPEWSVTYSYPAKISKKINRNKKRVKKTKKK